MSFKKRVGILTDVPFWYSSAGNHVRIEKCISDIVDNSYVIVIYLGWLSKTQKKNISETYGIEIIALGSIIQYGKLIIKNLVNKYFPFMRNILVSVKKPETLMSYQDESICLKVESLVNRKEIEIIIVEYIWLYYYVANLGIKRIIDTHDVQSDRCKSYNSINKQYNFQISLNEEIEILNKFDSVVAISVRDKSIFDEYLYKPSIYVPYVPQKQYVEHHIRTDILQIAFIGSAVEFNIDAIQWFVNNVWSDMLAICPNISLNIYGGVSSYIHSDKQNNINSIGYVEDIKIIYSRNDIIINPIRIGGGMKIKNIESLSYSVPLITTDVGSQGIEEGKGRAYFVANTKEDYIELIKLLHDDVNSLNDLVVQSGLFFDYYLSKQISFNDIL